MSKDFSEFNDVLDKYMPAQGEGETIASQIATAVAKIAYRWFNDGDTISSKWNVEGESLPGGVSQYGNWLNKNVLEAHEFFDAYIEIFDGHDLRTNEYEVFLYRLCEHLLNFDLLDGYSTEPKRDSIYNSGKYKDGIFQGEDDEDNW